MTDFERILAACSGDTEQAEYVVSLLSRPGPGSLTAEEAPRTPAVATGPAEQTCWRCCQPLDEDMFCAACGATTKYDSPAAQALDGRTRGGARRSV